MPCCTICLSLILAYLCSFISFCDCAQCMNFPVSPHATLNSKSQYPFNLGETVTFRCEDGYRFQTHIPMARCTKVDDGYSTWKYYGDECKPHCNEFPIAPHAKMIELRGKNPPFHLDEKVGFHCEMGYGAFKYIEAICKQVEDKARWILPLPKDQCKLVDCEFPGDVEDAKHVGDNYTYLDTVTYVCNLGFEIAGNPTLTCSADGSWEPRYKPYCKVLTCPSLSFPKHGYVRDYSKTYNTVAKYECDIGYHLKGEADRTCLADKTWTGSEPSCVVTICFGPGAIENGRVYNLKDEYQEGEIIIFVCNNEPQRHSSSCLKNGDWSERPPLCEGEKSTEGTSSSTVIMTVATSPAPTNATVSDSFQDNEGAMTLTLIIGIAVGCALVLISIIVLIVMCYRRRWRFSYGRKALPSDAVYLGELRKLEKSRKQKY